MLATATAVASSAALREANTSPDLPSIAMPSLSYFSGHRDADRRPAPKTSHCETSHGKCRGT